MRRHRAFTEPVAQMPREPLREPTGVHENQCRPMRRNERRETVVVFLPDFVGHDGFER